MASSTGDLIAGRYRIATRLGRGGMGTVWRARDELLGRAVAVKELHVDHELPHMDAELQRERTLREARSVAQVRHPNIMVLHDVVAHEGQPWIVMELIDGRSLADRVALEGTLAPVEGARIGLDLLAALRAAHTSGVQHRDLKPANVLLEASTGRVVLSDFGIAQVAGQTTLTETGSFVGSPEYTAPERMSGARTGPESDLWSLGVLLCAVVGGVSPFHRDSVAGVLHAVVMDEIRLPEAALGGLLPVVRGLLDREVADRLTLDEAEKLLRAFVEETQFGPAPAPSTTPAAGPVVDPSSPTDPRASLARPPAAPSEAAPSPAPPSHGRTRRAPGASRGPRTRVALLAGVLVAVLAAGGAGTGVWLLTKDGTSNAGHEAGPAAPSRAGDAGTAAPDGPEGNRLPAPSTDPSASPRPDKSRGGAGSSGADDDPGTAPDGGAKRTPSSDPTPDQGGDAPDAPAGYRTVTDPAGFRMAVPNGYTRSYEGGRVYYYSPGKEFRLGVHPQPQDPDGPLAVMQQAHQDGPDDYPGYRDGSVRETTHNGNPAALWQFTWDGTSSDGGARRTYDMSWDEAGKMYDVWISGPTAQQGTAKAHFDTALESFKVAG